jgi:hypothetical protein
MLIIIIVQLINDSAYAAEEESTGVPIATLDLDGANNSDDADD